MEFGFSGLVSPLFRQSKNAWNHQIAVVGGGGEGMRSWTLWHEPIWLLKAKVQFLPTLVAKRFCELPERPLVQGNLLPSCVLELHDLELLCLPNQKPRFQLELIRLKAFIFEFNLLKLKWNKIKNFILESHWPHFKYSLTTWDGGWGIAWCPSFITESSLGQSGSRKWAPGAVGASTCSCHCLECQSCQSSVQLSSVLVKQWVLWGLGISAEQVRSRWKQLVKSWASRLAHTQRKMHICTETYHSCLRGPGGEHFSGPGNVLLLACSPWTWVQGH